MRRFVEGDVIPAPARAVEAPVPAENANSEAQPSLPEAVPTNQDAPILPDTFIPRIRKLPFNTILKVPPQFRQCLCDITAGCIEGANRGESVYAALDEVCSKLLLGLIPKEANTIHELRIRFDMWNKRDFEGLLARAEK